MGKEKTAESQNIIDKIWSLFASIRLAVITFSLISILSIVGTIIEQQAEPAKNIQLLSKIFGGAAPQVYSILNTLGFMDMYRSWWFITLLFIFAANIVICSIDRLPRIWKVTKEPIKPLSPEILNTMSIKKEITLKGKLNITKDVVESAMKKIGFKPMIHLEENALQFYAEKGRYSRLGVYITHFSIILIFIGAIVGIFFGFNGGVNIPEGGATQVAYVGRGGRQIPLGFTVAVDDFEVDFYEGTDTPKEFKSWLTVLENGRLIMRKQIEVNVPLRYKGITFYQSSYGYNPRPDSLFKFTVASKGRREEVGVKFNESFSIPGTNITGKVVDFSPALGIDEKGNVFTYAEMMNNPAAFVEFTENGKSIKKQWILKRYPQTWRVSDGIIVEFKDLWGAQYTGLQVRKDPGVWIVYLGCVVMAIGLYAAFFMSHTKIWIRLKEEKNITKISIAASTNKNKVAFEQKIDRIVKLLSH